MIPNIFSAMKSLLVSVFVFAGLSLAVQAQEISKYDLERRAENHFQSQRYLKACGDYEILYNMYPKDAEYAYFLGRSYLHSNRYLDRAAELLKFAARRNFGEDAYFYLGQAYHLNYRFEDAALAFITFQKQASPKVLKKFDVDYWIAVTSNARQSVEVAQNLKIESLHAIPSNAMESAFKELTTGKYIYVPEEFRSKTDKENDYHSLMFLPEQIEVGDYVYFSSQSKKEKGRTDIYRSRRINGQDYSVPEPVSDVINTAYDEEYPYFDKASSTLYFSSKGFNTSGGYDIFRSEYNAENDEWTTPEKLDFPINSVHDDFLYTKTEDQNKVIFITNRNSTPMELEAYTMELLSPGNYLSPANRDEVITLALLSPSSIVIDKPIINQISEELENPSGALAMQPAMELTPKEKYALYIQEALEMQVQSDSLSSIARELRSIAMDEQNYQKKQELIASITSLEKESKRLQHEADMKFKMASQLRKNEVQEQLAELTPAATTGGITAYTYNTAKKKDPPAENNYQKGYKAAIQAGEEFAAGFQIMNNSPYSKNNPIPLSSLPGGLIYRIQLGAYTNEIPENTFRGLTPVSKEKTASSTKYYVGMFSSINEARNALQKVKDYGYPDAFLVSFFDQNKISVQEAREIEFANR